MMLQSARSADCKKEVFMQRKSDLYVITKVITEYIITVTEKSPKKFRFTLVARLQNYCLDVVENLYLAVWTICFFW